MNTPPAPTFGELLRFARQAAGMSQRALAQFLEVSAPYLSDVERDRRSPLTPARAATACRRLGINILAEAKARATSTGFFRLEARADSQHHMIAGGLLALAWYWLNTDDLRQIEVIALGALMGERIDVAAPPK
jgi:transcriptional regulator with XRE-family HTH domain